MSKIYFTDYRIKVGDSRLKKLIRLVKSAGIDKIDFKNKYVAIKVHFGEWGNLGFIRHQYAKVLCDFIKDKGGKPFLTDANTLYIGYRNNALDHLDCAFQNGYNSLSTGVHTIIADGLRGTDERLVPVENGIHVKQAKIASAIAEADILIALTHCKGHHHAGFAATFKNIGMGSGSKAGKMEMHSSDTPMIKKERCIGCGACSKHCNNNGINIIENKAVINENKCVGCGYCFAYCTQGAINCKWDEAKVFLNEKIAEYSKAALHNKQSFFINFVETVTKHCDCKPGNDVGMIPDIGIFASFDPVALDSACIEAINNSPIFENSPAGKECLEHGETSHDGIINSQFNHDIFTMVHPETKWKACLNHAEKLGLGKQKFEIIKIK